MELGHRPLPGFKCWRGVVNSLCEKFLETFTGSGVVKKQVKMTCGQQPHIYHC